MASGSGGQKNQGKSSESGDKSSPSRTIDLDPSEVKDETPAQAKGTDKSSAKPADAKSDGGKPASSSSDGKAAASASGTASKAEKKPETSSKSPGQKAAEKPASPPPSSTAAAPPPPPQKRGGGFMSAGLGGIVGAAIVYGASVFGLLPSGGDSGETAMSITSLEQSVAGLRDEIATTGESVSTEDFSTLSAQVSALAEAQSSAEAAGDGASLEGVGEIMASLEALRADVDALQASPSEAGDTSALAERTESLAADLANLTDTAGQTATDFTSRIGAIESRLDAIGTVDVEGSPDPALAQALADLSGRVDELASAAPAAGGEGVDLSPLQARLDAVESQVSALESAPAVDVDLSSVDALGARVEALEGQVSALPDVEAPVAELGGQIAGLEESLAALTSTVDANAVDLTPLTEDVAGVKASAEEALANAASVNDALAALQTTVGDLGARIEAVAEEAGSVDEERQAATLVALAGLQRAAQGSGPFETELSALSTLMGADAELVTTLQGFAASGVPSLDDVEAGFAGQTAAIIQASAKAEADTVLSRLSAGAQSLVRIRPSGFVAGDSPAAKVARIEALLGEGKLAEALSEWETLDDAAKSATSSWASGAQNRLALNRTLEGSAASTATN